MTTSVRRLLVATAMWLFALTATSAVGAPILQTDSNGILIGAKGVLVDGFSYDVEFKEGSCALLFSGCDSSSDFRFNRVGAASASRALLDFVLIGSFDTAPALTFGCADDVELCSVMTPYAGSNGFYFAGLAENRSGDIVDVVNDVIGRDVGTVPRSDVVESLEGLVYAIWSSTPGEPAPPNPPPEGVPEPSSLLLLGTAIAMLALRRPKPAVSVRPSLR